ncbi:M15 family metallopeptidase [Microbacterium sp. P07]|uniref:M15 family metallopeptidase n=1 Tax=Microbacterium sp. P07 TaxID=3366952 RepID=UPI0037467492
MFRSSDPVAPSTSRRRVVFVAVGAAIAALLAALVTAMVSGAFAAAVAPLARSVPFSPSAEDGLIAAGEMVTLADDDVPAIARLNPALREAMQDAETDAAVEALSFQITSGWRSPEYQEWLLQEAVDLYGSEEVARQFVATPERSTHVTGDGIDIGPIDAQFWLIEHGSRFGICQTYANERWHFELATVPGGVCPEMRADAAS